MRWLDQYLANRDRLVLRAPAPVLAPAPELPVADEPCSDCDGHGYAAFRCDGVGHSSVELQSCDSCDARDGDGDAAIAFVRELERGDRYARKVARIMIREGAPEAREDY